MQKQKQQANFSLEEKYLDIIEATRRYRKLKTKTAALRYITEYFALAAPLGAHLRAIDQQRQIEKEAEKLDQQA